MANIHINIISAFTVIFLIISMSSTSITGKMIQEKNEINASFQVNETDFVISGPTRGYIGISYDYTFYLNPNEYADNFSLLISWRIDNNTGWMGPFPTGENISISNAWDKRGFYTIQAFAKCNITIYYQIYEVTITKSKILYKAFFLTFIKRLPLFNLLLQRII
jgi:hypothetical protein